MTMCKETRGTEVGTVPSDTNRHGHRGTVTRVRTEPDALPDKHHSHLPPGPDLPLTLPALPPHILPVLQSHPSNTCHPIRALPSSPLSQTGNPGATDQMTSGYLPLPPSSLPILLPIPPSSNPTHSSPAT